MSFRFFLCLAILMPLLGGCITPWKKDAPPPAQPAQEVWCYRSLAEADCYSQPQNVHADGLINVDPTTRYPATPEDYAKEVAGSE